MTASEEVVGDGFWYSALGTERRVRAANSREVGIEGGVASPQLCEDGALVAAPIFVDGPDSAGGRGEVDGAQFPGALGL